MINRRAKYHTKIRFAKSNSPVKIKIVGEPIKTEKNT